MGEPLAARDMRKHLSWYVTGYPVGPEVRRRLGQIESLAELDDLLAGLDPLAELVPGGARASSGVTRTGRSRWRCRIGTSMTSTTPRFPTTGSSWHSPADEREERLSARARLASPRRRELLQRLGVEFDVRPPRSTKPRSQPRTPAATSPASPAPKRRPSLARRRDRDRRRHDDRDRRRGRSASPPTP